MRPTRGPGRSEHAVSTRTACSHFARFARINHHCFHTRCRSPRCSLAFRAARLACSARFARRLASAGLRSCFARACRLACLLRSPCRLIASLDPPFPLLAPLVVSPAALLRFAFGLRSGRFSCLLAPLAASPAVLSFRLSARLLLAPLAASTAALVARRWRVAAPPAASLRSPSTCLSRPAALCPTCCPLHILSTIFCAGAQLCLRNVSNP